MGPQALSSVLLMMDWFRLRPQSTAALAEFTLCLVIAFYLMSLRQKSQDGLLVTGLFVLHALYNAVSFLRNSAFDTYAYAAIVWVHSVILIFLALYHLVFCYTYRQNPFPKEMRLVLLLSTVALAIGLNFHRVGFPWTFPIHFVIAVWIVVVFVRKAIWSVRPHQVPGPGETSATTRDWEIIRHEFLHPSNRDTKAYRVFALWCLLLVLTWLNANLGIFQIIPGWWEPVHHAFYLVLLTWVVINFMTYAEETTTFLAKLVGLFMCLTLVLLGMLGFLLYGIDNTVGGGDENKEKALRILAYLIPISTLIIVLVFPAFFRSNLLRPLSYVLKGVQRVNEGELRVEVPVEVQDEIGALAQQFNHMTASLRRYAEQMESLVAKRTVELKRKSDELELQKEELQHTLDHLKAAQDQLVQSEKMASLGELTAGIAHEIQNPLNFVNNFSELSTELVEELGEELKQQLAPEKSEESEAILADLKQNLGKIYQHGLRADAIVKGMLQHSRKSTGHKERTDINALADEYFRLSYHGLRAKDKSFNANMVTDFGKDVGKVEVVPQDFGRVLLNLYNNAFYAVQQRQLQSPEGYKPEVSVSTRRRGDTVEIRVRDNGLGIAKEAASRIFQPFFTTKPSGQGTGLGLSLSFDIITKGHGGKITFETAEGEFTEFIVQVPIRSTAEAAAVDGAAVKTQAPEA